MATKTITLELDAFEKLRQAQRGGESFTEVVRRAVWMDPPATGAMLLDYYRKGGSGVSKNGATGMGGGFRSRYSRTGPGQEPSKALQ